MCIPKAANTSLKLALMDSLGISGSSPHHAKHFEYTGKDEIANLDDSWLTISIVRNPYERLASCWADKVMGERKFFGTKHPEIKHHMPFKNFCRVVANIPDCKADQHFRSQVHDLCVEGRLLPHIVLQMENMENGWNWIRSLVHGHCGLDLPPITHAQKTQNKASIDREDKALINIRYRQDFEMLEYQVEYA